MLNQPAKIDALYCYPVKGLSPQPLGRTTLSVGQTVPADRLYAIENGLTGFDPAAPAFINKLRFLMLVHNERLARLRTDYDEASHTLIVHAEGREAARGDLRSAEGRATIERFFATYCADELNGPPKILASQVSSGPAHSFSNQPKKVVSIINLASVAAVEIAAGAVVHPLRFRGNIYVSGWPAWHEFELIGSEIGISNSARLKVVKRIVRCAATEVDPDTGIRDMRIPRTLM